MSNLQSKKLYIFNKYFVNIGPNIISKMSHPTQSTYAKYLNTNFSHTMFLTPAAAHELGNIISGLKSGVSSGHDDLSTDVLMTTMDNSFSSLL